MKVGNKHDYAGSTPDFKGSQIPVTTSGFEISTFLPVEAATLNSAGIDGMTVSKTKVSKKTITAKISNIKKRKYNLFIFQKIDKNRVLNTHSISNCSDHLFSVSYGYILSFIV